MLRAYSKSDGTGKRRPRPSDRADGRRVAAQYAATLLKALAPSSSSELIDESVGVDRHPALAWAASGVMAITGPVAGPPALAPGHLAATTRGAVAAFAALAGSALRDRTLDGPALLGERAALLGLARRGTTSAGGDHCRLVRARDGWIAVNLPRADDIATVPAWLERASDADPWDTIAAAAVERSAAALVARGRLLGLAIADAPPLRDGGTWCRVAARGRALRRDADAPPLVVDLSALWAGPLASHLLALAGARVIKVESARRPDGARRGSAAFFDLLHAGKQSVSLDFTTPAGRTALRRLVARADIVIESARPRAASQLGIDPAALVRARPGLTWISITGYGRTGSAKNWIAFGDDAACAAGLAHATGALAASPTPLFCGDAIADPLTGLHAAVAALAAHRSGGGVLLALALRDVAAHAAAFGPAVAPAIVVRPRRGSKDAWEVIADGERQPVASPRARPVVASARPFGADTDAVLRALDVG